MKTKKEAANYGHRVRGCMVKILLFFKYIYIKLFFI